MKKHLVTSISNCLPQCLHGLFFWRADPLTQVSTGLVLLCMLVVSGCSSSDGGILGTGSGDEAISTSGGSADAGVDTTTGTDDSGTGSGSSGGAGTGGSGSGGSAGSGGTSGGEGSDNTSGADSTGQSNNPDGGTEGGTEGGTAGGADPTATQSGEFVDSTVSGVSYQTNTLNGDILPADGRFEFVAGETVTFSIGALQFPAATAKSVLTPLDLAETTELTNPVVINIARLLQTLDVDGDTSNGIEVPSGAAGVATSVDFTQDVASFEASANVINLVSMSGSVTNVLIPEDQALSHLLETLSTLDQGDAGASSLSREEFTGLLIGNSFTRSDGATVTYLVDSEDSESGSKQVLSDGNLQNLSWNYDSNLFPAKVLCELLLDGSFRCLSDVEDFLATQSGDTVNYRMNGQIQSLTLIPSGSADVPAVETGQDDPVTQDDNIPVVVTESETGTNVEMSPDQNTDGPDNVDSDGNNPNEGNNPDGTVIDGGSEPEPGSDVDGSLVDTGSEPETGNDLDGAVIDTGAEAETGNDSDGAGIDTGAEAETGNDSDGGVVDPGSESEPGNDSDGGAVDSGNDSDGGIVRPGAETESGNDSDGGVVQPGDETESGSESDNSGTDQGNGTESGNDSDGGAVEPDDDNESGSESDDANNADNESDSSNSENSENNNGDVNEPEDSETDTGSTGAGEDQDAPDNTDGSSDDPADGSSDDPADGSSDDPADGSSDDPADGSSDDPADGSNNSENNSSENGNSGEGGGLLDLSGRWIGVAQTNSECSVRVDFFADGSFNLAENGRTRNGTFTVMMPEPGTTRYPLELQIDADNQLPGCTPGTTDTSGQALEFFAERMDTELSIYTNAETNPDSDPEEPVWILEFSPADVTD